MVPRGTILLRNHLSLTPDPRGPAYGSAVSDLDFTKETSALLMKPLALTSLRKFDAVNAFPDCDFVCLMSEELTEPFAFVSPRSALRGRAISPVVTKELAEMALKRL